MEKSFSDDSDGATLPAQSGPAANDQNSLVQQTAPSGELVEGEISTSKVFQHFYAKLVKMLPMDDALFIAELFSANLLPGDVKDQVKSMSTSADKATHLLDHVIQPSVMTGVGSSYDDLIKVMENSEYDGVKELGGIIRSKLKNPLKNVEAGAHLSTSKHECPTVKYSPAGVSRLQARYLRYLSTDWPHYYIRLALVKGEKVKIADKSLEEVTRRTLKGQVCRKLLKKKGHVEDISLKREKLGELRDIFHYQSKPCPRIILIMGGPGIGKTTLANEICVKWAKRDGFLAEDYEIVILIPLRSVQQRSTEEEIIEHIGEEMYEQVKKSAGSRCLVILEGLDEMAAEHRESDPFLVRVMKCTLLEEATIMITSRPHACEKVEAGRRVEVVGFGKEEIQEFVKKSFPNDLTHVEFLQQLKEYPHLESLSYVPMNLVMIVDIFECSGKKLPSTITELYRLFIVMTIQREVKKNETKQVCSIVASASSVDEKLCKVLTGIPKEAVRTLLLLCRLAYRGCFDWCFCHKKKLIILHDVFETIKDPKIVFSMADLKECSIEVTAEWDGYGLLKATHTHQLPTDTITYSFSHLTIQEFLCAVYISTLSQKEQQCLMREQFIYYPNIFIFLCGVTGLVSKKIFKFLISKLSHSSAFRVFGSSFYKYDYKAAARCLHESKQTSPLSVVSPVKLKVNRPLPYDIVCTSYVMSCYPVSELCMSSHIGDKGAELLVKYCPSNNKNAQLEKLNLWYNDLTIDGLIHIMKILKTNSASLRVLDISHNPIGNDGMSLISSELLSNKILTKLTIAECGLSVKGAICISEVLGKCSLQILDMSYNNIGDDGITAITRALSNSQISILDVSRCGITLTGARSLAAGLLVNNRVRILGVSGNSITVKGARLILRSAVDNGVCHRVAVDNEWFGKQRVDEDYRDDDEVKKMMSILAKRHIVELYRQSELECDMECASSEGDDMQTSEEESSGDDELVKEEETARAVTKGSALV